MPHNLKDTLKKQSIPWWQFRNRQGLEEAKARAGSRRPKKTEDIRLASRGSTSTDTTRMEDARRHRQGLRRELLGR